MISPRVAIDAGVKALGWARGTDRILSAGCSRTRDKMTIAQYADLHARAIGAGTASRVALELMHWDGRRMTTPGDLLDVQAIGCLVAARVGGELSLYLPHEWTRVSKEIGTMRMAQVLDASELAIVQAAAAAATKAHAKEVLDAARLFLYDAGRIDKSGSPRR